MERTKPRVTIVGLGLIGGSIGLALRQVEAASSVVGHDVNREASAQANKLGAVDKTHWNLLAACEDADLVILATPVDAVQATLEAIGPHLRPGCVVVDTAAVKRPVLAWAAEHLPDSVFFVGGNPILGPASDGLGGLAEARSDLFQGGLFCIVPSPAANENAVELVVGLVQVLGAKPLFLDVAEHDGLVAAVDHLPALLDLALMEMVVGQPTWRELRKMAGPSFELGTGLVSTDPAIYAGLCQSNRDNVLRWIDAFSNALDSVRGALVEDEPDVLAERFLAALVERQKWLADRSTGLWQEGPRTEMPERPSLIDSFLGTFWRRKPKPGA
jgi:prephenate dehydrogenase